MRGAELKTAQFILRMTPEEKSMLKAKAGKAGITQSEYVRKLIRSEKVHEHDKSVLSAIQSLIYEINKIGVNINQVVHNVNMGKYSDHEKRKLFALMGKVYDIVTAIAASGMGKG